MTHVMGFDSFDGAMEYMRKAEEAANARLHPAQRAITWGDYWARPVPEYGMVEFGRVYTQAEAFLGEDKESVAATVDSHERGYRYGMAYSKLGPEGELGSTHVANMVPITKEMFEHARKLAWGVNEKLLAELREAAAKVMSGD
jgi:hypothetical protein